MCQTPPPPPPPGLFNFPRALWVAGAVHGGAPMNWLTLRRLWQSGLFTAGVSGERHVCCSPPVACDDVMLPSLPRNQVVSTDLFAKGALDKLFLLSCDLCVLHVVLTPSQTTIHT